MKKIAAVSMLAAAALGLAACSDKAQNEAAEAANAVGTDIENTADAAVDTVDNALDGAGNAMDNAGEATENAAEGAANATGNALTEAGNEVKGN